jgi:haloacetate dehalogenase
LPVPWFDGFQKRTISTSGTEIHLITAGSGPALLLLHGYPQTHLMWRHLAPRLAERFTVVAPDLRGYGESGKPATDATHSPYSKRAMAADMAEVMTALGHDRFSVVGHDRGGRVAHRLARDHRARVARLSVLDICPTLDMYERTDMDFATGYYHWYFLIQPFDFPERLIGADPGYYMARKMALARNASAFPEDVMAEYRRHFSKPETIHATCEDYRASATLDLDHDRADRDRPLSIPIQVLWGGQGVVGRTFDPIAIWSPYTDEKVSGTALPCGHFLAEEEPEETLAHLLPFLEG